MNMFEISEKDFGMKNENFYPEGEEKSREEIILEVSRELDDLFDKINMEHLLVLDKQTVDKLIEKSYVDLKERLERARGKGQLTH